MNATPRKIEWAGPEGWTIWADEDGVHLRAANGSALEMPDVERLFNLWQEARAAVEAGHIGAPKPPTREEIRAAGFTRSEEYVRRRAIRAIDSEFAVPTDAPF